MGSLPDGLRHGIQRWRQRWRRLRRRPRWGNLRRFEPFSQSYGFERGRPVDRIYIEQFLAAHADDIRGAVLEVKDAAYTRAFGGSRVASSDVLDLDRNNPEATLFADLGSPGSLPQERFDCVICTQTLHLIPRLDTALRNLWNSLRHGGVLLLTVPTVTRIEFSYEHADDLWRFTPVGLSCLLQTHLPDADTAASGRGNLLTTISYLLGLAAEDLCPEDFSEDDPAFPLIAAARVIRPRR